MARGNKASKTAKTKGKITKFFKEIINELKKVTGLTKPQLVNNTIVVLIMCLFVGVMIWLMDLGFSQMSQLIYK